MAEDIEMTGEHRLTYSDEHNAWCSCGRAWNNSDSDALRETVWQHVAPAGYAIQPIDPTVAFIVTVNDRPIVSAATGEPVRFVRRIDAERFVAER